ncbi:MAG: hypothetical protein P8Z67_14385 [Gammaproteobacteria bacterium]
MRKLVDSLELKSKVEVGVKPPKYEPYICEKAVITPDKLLNNN